MTWSLYRTPCGIKLVDNPERDCYAGVMTQFDEETRLLNIKCLKNRLINLYRKCPCETECDERQFLSRVNVLFITFINLSFILLLLLLFQVSTSTWPSGQYWQDLGLEFFEPEDFQVSHLHSPTYKILLLNLLVRLCPLCARPSNV